jgi:hypothetical protein
VELAEHALDPDTYSHARIRHAKQPRDMPEDYSVHFEYEYNTEGMGELPIETFGIVDRLIKYCRV